MTQKKLPSSTSFYAGLTPALFPLGEWGNSLEVILLNLTLVTASQLPNAHENFTLPQREETTASYADKSRQQSYARRFDKRTKHN